MPETHTMLPSVDREKYDREHQKIEPDRLDRTLFATAEALRDAKIPYGFIGGVAVKGLGRPRKTNDIDVFVSPDDAERALKAFAERGFETEKRDPNWLYKAWRENVLVDIIFKSTGDIYFDEEMKRHVKTVMFHGHELKIVSPEDFIVIKSAVYQEDSPHHWYDALAVITQSGLDWEYLLWRSRHAPKRVLSLLIYAQSNGMSVPDQVIRKLFQSIYASSGASSSTGSYATIVSSSSPASASPPSASAPPERTVSSSAARTLAAEELEPYLIGRIKHELTSDQRTADQDVDIIISGQSIVVRGEVFNAEMKEAIEDVIQRTAPHHPVDNQVIVRVFSEPQGSEAIL